MDSLREARMAGTWYPGTSADLRGLVDGLLQAATAEEAVFEADTRLGGLIAPHAGYLYSGAVAARAYACLRIWRPTRVVVVAPSHREWFRGACAWAPPGSGDGSWRTPLGDVPVDGAFRERLLAASGRVVAGTAGHGQEHSLELQLPFLQAALGRFRLVPVAMGEQNAETALDLASGLAAALDGEPTLLVASTDLSHFHGLEDARRLDARALGIFAAGEARPLLEELHAERLEACGAGPVAAVLEALRLATGSGPRVEILDYRTSADASGDASSVVGYGAAICRTAR